MYESRATDLYVLMGVLFPMRKRYVKTPIYGQQTQELQQQLWYIHAWIQPKVTVNIPTITWASILHSSYGYVRDDQWTS